MFDAMDSLKAAVLEYDEEDVVEGEEEVAVEMEEALHSVRELGAVRREQIAMRFCDLYREQNGEEPSLSDLYSMFGHVQECFAEEALSSDLDQETATEHPAQFAVEWASAMDHVREIAKWHREELVVRLSAIYEEDMLRPPTVGALAEILEVVQQHFADEAMHELLEDDLVISTRSHSDDDDQGRAQNEDSDYCPESDAADHAESIYTFDVLDDVLYCDLDIDVHSDSDCKAEDEGASDSDSDFSAKKDAVDLEAQYADDEEDDLAESTSTESEDEQKAAELGSDSEYSPDQSSFDYFGDYKEEHAETDTTADTEEEHELSDTASESGQSADGGDAVNYNPDYDLFDYSLDFELFQDDEDEDITDSAFESGLSESGKSEAASQSVEEDESQSQDEDEEESDDDDDYVVECDTFDYSQDEIEESVEEEADDQESGSSADESY